MSSDSEKAKAKRYRASKRDDAEWQAKQRERERQSYASNPEHKRAQARQWRQDNPERHLFNESKRRAKKKGWEFNLELSDIIIPVVCPVFGMPLVLGSGDNSPSLDRIDSSKGYLKGNVRVISWKANRIKSDATAEDLEKILAYIKT